MKSFILFLQLLVSCWTHNPNTISNVYSQIPKPFVISTTLGVNPPKKPSDLTVRSEHHQPEHIDNSQSLQTLRRNYEKNYDRRKENDRFYNFQKEGLENFVSHKPVNKNSPKINFYNMNCAVGHKCTAIIPGPKTRMPIPKHQNDDEIKLYLKRHGLENGFNYSNDDRVNKNNVVARYFKGAEEKKRKARKIFSNSYKNDYWPGSQYRPTTVSSLYDQNIPETKSKSEIYKYRVKSTKDWNSRPTVPTWTDIRPQSSYRPTNSLNIANELPYPAFAGTESRPNYVKYSRPKSKGVWNKFSNSIVSQYDKYNDNWVKISSSNSNLGSGYINNNKRPFQNRPTYYRPESPSPFGETNIGITGKPTYQKPGAIGLTVLGAANSANSYYDTKTRVPSYKPEYPSVHATQSNSPLIPERPLSSNYAPTNTGIWKQGIVYRL